VTTTTKLSSTHTRIALPASSRNSYFSWPWQKEQPFRSPHYELHNTTISFVHSGVLLCPTLTWRRLLWNFRGGCRPHRYLCDRSTHQSWSLLQFLQAIKEEWLVLSTCFWYTDRCRWRLPFADATLFKEGKSSLPLLSRLQGWV